MIHTYFTINKITYCVLLYDNTSIKMEKFTRDNNEHFEKSIIYSNGTSYHDNGKKNVECCMK